MKLVDILTNEDKTKIEKLVEQYKASKNSEFEISFFSNQALSSHLVTLEQINQLNSVLNIISSRNGDSKIEHTKTLDVLLSLKEHNSENFTNYRVTINTTEKINEYMTMLHHRKNHLIFSMLVGYMAESKDDSITLIKKTKQRENYITIEDIYARFKLDKEEQVTQEEITKLQKVNT